MVNVYSSNYADLGIALSLPKSHIKSCHAIWAGISFVLKANGYVKLCVKSNTWHTFRKSLALRHSFKALHRHARVHVHKHTQRHNYVLTRTDNKVHVCMHARNLAHSYIEIDLCKYLCMYV